MNFTCHDICVTYTYDDSYVLSLLLFFFFLLLSNHFQPPGPITISSLAALYIATSQTRGSLLLYATYHCNSLFSCLFYTCFTLVYVCRRELFSSLCFPQKLNANESFLLKGMETVYIGVWLLDWGMMTVHI